MELMNNFLNYVGIDSTFIHPNALVEHALAENGVLYLSSGQNVMKFKLVILPSMSIISLKALRIIKKFYDEGGKIIATDNLPTEACECGDIFTSVNAALESESAEDREVQEIIKYIFGEDVLDNKKYRMYYKNENEKGGAAYYLPSNKRSVDGTESVAADILFQATENFGIAPDVYIDNMPRREFLGILNYHLPAFMKVGVDKQLASGCSINYLHKKYAGCDIYYNGRGISRKYSPERKPYSRRMESLHWKSTQVSGTYSKVPRRNIHDGRGRDWRVILRIHCKPYPAHTKRAEPRPHGNR